MWEEGPPREPGARPRAEAPAPGQIALSMRIRRYRPDIDREAWWQEATVNMEPSDRLLDALHQVKWYLDGSLALRRSCAHGVCGSDAMVINGRNALACKVLVRDVAPKVTIEPIRGLRVLKDLVVDMEPFFAGYRRILPFLINDEEPPERERRQSPAERERYDDTTKCILCAACTTSCPIFWGDDEYIGPAAIVNAHRFIFRGGGRAARRPGRPDGRLQVPDGVQLHRGLPPRHQSDQGHPGGQAGHHVRPALRTRPDGDPCS